MLHKSVSQQASELTWSWVLRYLVRLSQVESQKVQAFVIQQLQLGVELLLFQAHNGAVSLHHQHQAPVANHMPRRLGQQAHRC